MSVTARGGYQIIDFQGLELNAETPVTIPGIFEQARGGLLKPTVLYNFVSDVDTYAPIYPEKVNESAEDIITILFSSDGYNYTIVILNTDSVVANYTEAE